MAALPAVAIRSGVPSHMFTADLHGRPYAIDPSVRPCSPALVLMRSLVALVALIAAPSLAQTGLTPSVAYDFGHQSPTVGLAFEVALPRGPLPLAPSVRPSAEYVFRDRAAEFSYGEGLKVFRGDLDVLARFQAPGAPFAPYAKAGVAVDVMTWDVPFLGPGGATSATRVMPTLGGGVGFGRFGVELTVGVGESRPARLSTGYRF